MRLLRLLAWVTGALLSHAVAQSYDFGTDLNVLTRRQDIDAPIIVGRLPLAPNGTVPLRREIRQLRADRYHWDLFILAMSILHYVEETDPMSWYQLAGIHGVPFQPWNGVEAVPGANESGYCMHSSVLFPLWHRPYLALFEQELYRIVNLIATVFANGTERRLYQQAASVFRIPYWDWSMKAPDGQTQFPDVFWSPVVDQYGPNGNQVIKNPLYSYSFRESGGFGDKWYPIGRWNETKRAPDTNVSVEWPPSMNDKVDKAMLSILPMLQRRLYDLFTNCHDFNQFGSKAWGTLLNDPADSLEAIHDEVHTFSGSGGHMTYVPLSSFDPVFIIHHTMVDRLVAMWQLLNPDAWITPMPAVGTSYNTLNGTIQNSSSPLTPFMASSDGKFWDSDMSRNIEAFGYTYAEILPPPENNQTARQTLVSRVKRLWGQKEFAISSDTEGRRQTERSSPKADPIQWKENSWVAFKPDIQPEAPSPPSSMIIQNNSYTDWYVSVTVSGSAVDGAVSVNFFFGQTPDKLDDWFSARNWAGPVSLLGMTMGVDSGVTMSGYLFLSRQLRKLVAAGYMADLSRESVEPFLRSVLQFRVKYTEPTPQLSKEIPAAEVPGLVIKVFSRVFRITPNSDEPDVPEERQFVFTLFGEN